jgi:hypothetical protein
MFVLLAACINSATMQLADPVDPGEVRVTTGGGLAALLPVPEEPPETAVVVAGAPGGFVAGHYVLRTGIGPRSDAGLRLSILPLGLGGGVKVALIESESFDLSLGPQVMAFPKLGDRASWYVELPLLVGLQPVDAFRIDAGVRAVYAKSESGGRRQLGLHVQPLVRFEAEPFTWFGLSFDQLRTTGTSERWVQVALVGIAEF